ncbi:uncharacterized protein KY384_006571 [Bacidia gigantensis]|uniref:uncharacterized protein n=1 Tax=Bacidia gigantensis TaxID=2732470 RepID=UPI001D03736B|nr:uncharacterized protein KY384_006571 [Bacidia gigantensis]KAG8528882.1 hypothetical protein KY384_006571 [Bacidia gigantensis]
MAAAPEKRYGTTPPISTAMPVPAELAANDALISELKKQNNFETPEETESRKVTLQLIQRITTEFVRRVSRLKNLPQSTVEAAGGKIFTYGSYRLGVYGPGSDIDTLVVVPKHVTREDFFEHFPPTLERMAPPGAVKEMTPVPDAFVPIIKLELSGISIDLIFARLALSSVSLSLTLKDTNILRGLEERDMRSLNGVRVTDEILDLVPQPKTFRTALRGIKLWAQRRAIYANVIGFPGGVAWAMMVARVCQLYPKATGSVVIGKFFRIMRQWKWPQPVLLKAIEDGPLQVRVWNPKIYSGDKWHLMPIITPAYPSMCATHNITMSTKKVIEKEWERAGDITDKIYVGQAQWEDLFAKHSFFTQDYKYYLSINAASRTEGAQQVWSGLVESKIRLLVQNLDNEPSIGVARPFNKGFSRVHHCKNENDVDCVIAGGLQFQAKDVQTETTDAINDPKHGAVAQGDNESITIPNGDSQTLNDHTQNLNMYTTTYYIGIALSADGTKRLDISHQSKTFKEICTSWPNYDEKLNALHISHIRNHDLPLDVFSTGESRPEKPKKKTTVKKRGHDASSMEIADAQESFTSQDGSKRPRHTEAMPT